MNHYSSVMYSSKGVNHYSSVMYSSKANLVGLKLLLQLGDYAKSVLYER